MNDVRKIVFLAGLGAPLHLYDDYLNDLKKRCPHMSVLAVEWWSQDDFGMGAVELFIGDADAILIGHSAGGVIALQVLAKLRHQIKKIVMLDSHFLRVKSTLLSINGMLDIILHKTDETIKNRVINAFSSTLINRLAFNKALEFAVDWVNTSFDSVSASIHSIMPKHSVLYVGSTNSHYEILSDEDKKAALMLWGRLNVDVQFLEMNHFDLIDPETAARLNVLILRWLGVDLF